MGASEREAYPEKGMIIVASVIKLVVERCQEIPEKYLVALSNPQKVFEVVTAITGIQDSPSEEFWVLFLNTKNKITGVEMISKGSLNSAIVHPREVFKSAILHNSAAVIFAHNHPSGDPAPSQEDIRLTTRLVDGGRLLGIEVLDHLVIGDGVFISMRQREFIS